MPINFFELPADELGVKNFQAMTILLGIGLLATAAFAGDEFTDFTSGPMPEIVKQEYAVTQRKLQSELSISQQHLNALALERKAAMDRAHEAAQIDETGLKLLRDFDNLLRTKYIDKKGKVQPGFQLESADVVNLNGLFQEHLAMTPFTGPVSVGQAQKRIAWALDYLSDIKDAHEDPDADNNSELQIISKKTRDEIAVSKKLNDLADILGVKLDPNLPPVEQPKALASVVHVSRPVAHREIASKKKPQKKAKHRKRRSRNEQD